MKKHTFQVGTAGWSIPTRYAELLPGDGSHLERYAQRLNAVEINSSFYRHHRVQTYLRWAESVPENFRFAVKVPRTLTHRGELTPLPEILDRFATEVHGLGSKLAVLLVQLPPKLVFEAPVARRFFHELRKCINVPIACEPRHPSCGSQRADSALIECAVARVAADPSPWPGADKLGGYDQLAYFRWHGSPRTYYSDYGQEKLESLWQQYALGNALATMDAGKEETGESIRRG